MFIFRKYLYICMIFCGLSYQPTFANESKAQSTSEIQNAFELWKNGQGSVFDLLSEHVKWTVAGYSPVSGTYKTKQEFIDQAVKPINSFFAKPLKPTVNHIIAQGNNVVVLWDGVAQAKDGRLYKNNYAWHFVMENKKAIEVTAYLDTFALMKLMD
ncbi:hypothetical protein OFN07_18345 [Acinetobacter baumannii]|uniref:nuclear transport factor 2 family protein n=2 Tax=Acinetobacter TaxID=469 RepID=UPI00101F959C|nr:nuclear transport factor 2 family protein [Acinetobacter baumannii]MDC4772635.1 hypothetical protein [Acinetobacter baumannii]MDC5615347.1 hypothetical protein [Acinetobacter baumannii]RYL13357.1 nuclear transport factor 2 family protein [Acinetobacter baumannii]RYL41285.1 nuclear transport factor 2 family protein [Acinetobacter baumannii]